MDSGIENWRGIMTTDEKKKAAQVLYPVLSSFECLIGESLRSVRQIYTEGCLGQLILDFESALLIVIADENDDSIDFRISDVEPDHDETATSVDATTIEPWVRFIGKPFAWSSLAFDQKGYCDGLLLSFGEIIFPQLVLSVMASSIEVGRIVKDSWVSAPQQGAG